VANKEEKFLEAKEDILNNLANLELVVSKLEDQEILIDDSSEFYNQIDDLINNAKTLNTPSELEMVIERAKTFEIKLDVFLAENGISSTEIIWPDLTPFY